MSKNPPVCDKYIAGSDQIWNPILTFGLSPAYFLSFVDEPLQKIAYAPSFGTDRNIRNTKTIVRYLLSFGYLSVREKSGQAIIENMTGRKSQRLIAEDLEEESAVIEPFYHAAEKFAPEYDTESVFEYIIQKRNLEETEKSKAE